MKNTSKSDFPYKTLGIRLKKERVKSAQTIAEVSGAVEVEENLLSSIEAGKVRPSEDLLDLLSNHFKLEDVEVLKLMELAGYTSDFHKPNLEDVIEGGGLSKTIIMFLSQDNKTMYTDGLDIHYDSNGLLFNFKQNVGHTKPLTVAKLGMSYDQARQVHKTLTKVLLHAKYLKGPSQIPKSTKNSKKN